MLDVHLSQANRLLFVELLGMLQPIAYCLRRYPPQLLQPLFVLLQHEIQQVISQTSMREGVEKATEKILQVRMS